MRRRIRLTEGDLHRIVKESVKGILKESNRFIEEEDVLLQDEDIFGDNDEHNYDCRCYDGWAIGVLSDIEDRNAPKQVRLKYPKLKEVLDDEELTNYVMTYRGLYDEDCAYKKGFRPFDIHYGDIMMALGEIDGVVSDNTQKIANQFSKMLQPPNGYRTNN